MLTYACIVQSNKGLNVLPDIYIMAIATSLQNVPSPSKQQGGKSAHWSPRLGRIELPGQQLQMHTQHIIYTHVAMPDVREKECVTLQYMQMLNNISFLAIYD